MRKRNCGTFLGKNYRKYRDDEKINMMATKAYHCLGDLSEDKPSLCFIYGETPRYYVGNWIYGYGFFNVKFPKKTTRKLTDQEVKEYSKKYIQIGHQMPQKLNISSK